MIALRLTQIFVFVCVVWVAALGTAAEEVSPGDSLPQIVVDAWKMRRVECDNVYWNLKIRELVTSGALNVSAAQVEQAGLLPVEDEWRTKTKEAWIDFEGPRIRNVISGETHYVDMQGQLIKDRFHKVNLFDGERLQTYFPNEHNYSRKEAEIWNRNPSGVGPILVFELHAHPLLWSTGRAIGPTHPVDSHPLNTSVKENVFVVHKIVSDELIVVRVNLSEKVNAYEEYEIDLTKDAAIVRKAAYARGRLRSEITVNWSETEFGWQPKTWKTAVFRPDGNLLVSSECRVVELRQGVDLTTVEFHIEPQPGTKYWDEEQNLVFVRAAAGKEDRPVDYLD